jgi:hypothetical protein
MNIKKASELYAIEEDDNYPMICDYQPMLGAFGNIVIKIENDDCQGDSRILYKEKYNNNYGYLKFGWGSCCGCDALQSCETIEELQKLMDELYSQIRIFTSAKEALDFFKTHDWEGDYDNSEEQKLFIKLCIHYFKQK